MTDMIMKVSKRAQAVPPSATLAVTARAKELKAQGINVIGFGAGEPDFDTPTYIKDAAIIALNAGKTKYTPASGTIELKKAIAEKLLRENKLDYKPEQIVVNIGAKHSVYGAMQAVLDPGDVVILPTPFWLTYPEAIKLAGAKVRGIGAVGVVRAGGGGVFGIQRKRGKRRTGGKRGEIHGEPA